MCVFCIILTMNSDYFYIYIYIYYKLICLCHTGAVCLLWGRNWICKYNLCEIHVLEGYKNVPKCLIQHSLKKKNFYGKSLQSVLSVSSVLIYQTVSIQFCRLSFWEAKPLLAIGVYPVLKVREWSTVHFNNTQKTAPTSHRTHCISIKTMTS